MRKYQWIGLAILVLVIILVVMLKEGSIETEVYKGVIGSEKANFLENEEIKKILSKKYGIVLDYKKAGSVELVINSLEEQKRTGKVSVDFLWPSSQIPLEIYKQEGGKIAKSEIIFNSPIVVYSWDSVADALMKLNIVKKIEDSYYIIDFPRFIDLVIEGKKWSEIGLADLYGRVLLISTDPTSSNSGNLFAGLLANLLYAKKMNDDTAIVDETSIDAILPKIKAFFLKLGYMEHSTGVLFEQYLTRGVGDKPMIVGYESQIIEFSLQNKKIWEAAKDRVRLLYPIPTVWSAHPLIATNEKGKKLIEALKDEEIQKIAWEKHGFRKGFFADKDVNMKILKEAGIPERIDKIKVIPMPSPVVMKKILDFIGTR